MDLTPTPGAMPEGLRDTTQWYLEVDPVSAVDPKLVDYIAEHGGQELLDLGCGVGGYAKLLGDRGRTVIAIDVNDEYVAIARGIGVDARVFDGATIPLPDNAVDTIFMVEVLEHIPDPASVLAELARVARRNVIITVPNNTFSFRAAVTFGHMLEVDHKNFFTRESLSALLRSRFPEVTVIEVEPLDTAIAHDLLPRWAYAFWLLAHKAGVLRDRIFFRLIADITL